MQQHATALLLLGAAALLAGCGSHDDLSRPFTLSRNAPGDAANVWLPPLSMPPSMADRPLRPGAMASSTVAAPAPTASLASSSPGQQAFLEAAGGNAPTTAEIRQQIDTDARMARPSPQVVSDLLNWTPPPGYVTLFAPPRKSWLGRIF